MGKECLRHPLALVFVVIKVEDGCGKTFLKGIVGREQDGTLIGHLFGYAATAGSDKWQSCGLRF